MHIISVLFITSAAAAIVGFDFCYITKWYTFSGNLLLTCSCHFPKSADRRHISTASLIIIKVSEVTACCCLKLSHVAMMVVAGTEMR